LSSVSEALMISKDCNNFSHLEETFRRFQEKSYESMKRIKVDFIYDKFKRTGETKDIAKLYLNFFLALKLQSRVDDLKRAYANNKYIGVILDKIE
jgi:hypothetical protein